MSAAPGASTLRARIAAALGAYLADHSQTAVGDLLGVAGTTIGRRADDLHAWPADDLLRLAVQSPDIAQAINLYLAGDQRPQGQAVRATSGAMGLVQRMGGLVAEIAGDLAGGRISPTEAQDLRTHLRSLIADAQALDDDLRAWWAHEDPHPPHLGR